MRGAGGCTGRYVLQDGLLTLFWDDWAPEALEKKRQRIFPRSVFPDPCRRQQAASFSGVRVLTGMASIPCSSHPSAVVRHGEGR